MKKIFSLMMFVITSVIFVIAPTYAQETEWEKEFIEDFDAYEVGKIEDSEAFKSKWTNDLWSGTNPSAVDINDVGQIKEETDNKFLNLNYEGDFFYIAPHNFRAKELEISMDVRVPEFDGNSWIGINTKKAYRDTRYNGGTGILVIFKHHIEYDESDNIVGESIVADFFRGGSLSLTDLNDDVEGDRKLTYNYPETGPVEENRLVGKWNNYKITIENTDVENEISVVASINGTVIGTLIHRRSSLNIFGYTSLNSTLGNFDVDNFKIESFDEVAPPPIIRLLDQIPMEGKVGEVFNLPPEDRYELIDDEDGKVEIVITPPTGEDIALELDTYAFTPEEAGVYIIRFIATSANGSSSYEEHSIVVTANETDPDETDPDETDPDETDPDETNPGDTDPEDTDDSGNNTLVIVLSIVGGLVIIGGVVAVIFIRKRK